MADLGVAADVFTVVRPPVDYVLSAHHFVRSLDDDAYETMWDGASPQALEMRGDDASWTDISGQLIAMSRSASPVEVITSRVAPLRAMYWHPFVRTLSTYMPASLTSNLSNLDAVLSICGIKIEAIAASARATLEKAAVVGHLEQLEAAILTLCLMRGWPSPPALPDIHRSNRAPTASGVNSNWQ